MRKIGYARVSTREQSINSQALEQQIERLRPHVDEILFDVESGKSDNRKNFKLLESLIKAGESLEVVVTRLDRLSRKLITLKKFIDLLTVNNGCIKALDNNIDTASAAGKFHISLLGALAEMESDQISERVRHGLNYLIKNGKGYHPPFGFFNENYKFVPDKRPFLCLLNSRTEWSRHDMAVLLIEKYLELKSLRSLEFWMRDNFNFSLNRSALSAWFKNPALLGHVYFKSSNEVFYDQHPPLTDKEKILQVLDLMKFQSKTKGYTKRCNYNLSGLIWCSCGHKASMRKSGKNVYIECPLYLRCPQKLRRIRYQKIENLVFSAISNRANKLSDCVSFNDSESPRVRQLQSELAQLEAIPTPHKSIVLAIQEIKSEIESERMKTSFDSSEGDRKLFIDTFSDPDFWEFFATEPLATRQALLRKFVKKIVFNPFKVEFY